MAASKDEDGLKDTGGEVLNDGTTDFSNVTWSDHVQEQMARNPSESENPADSERDGRPMGIENEPHALGSERLDCTVGAPIKENDGTKDAFTSYLITTNVSSPRRQTSGLCSHSS